MTDCLKGSITFLCFVLFVLTPPLLKHNAFDRLSAHFS